MGGRLRIIGFHGVPDRRSFEGLLDWVGDHFRFVSGAEVARAWQTGHRLPDRSVWLTFDDGRPDVVTNALPALLARGIPATMFVCPGIVESRQPFWWDVIAAAQARGWSALASSEALRVLKQVPDPVRRAYMADAARSAGPVPADSVTLDQCRAWRNAGLEVGNHSWDHPLLPACEDAEQVSQIDQAHDWLLANDLIDRSQPLFAYPNGASTTVSRDRLDRIGYGAAVTFDHRMAKTGDDRLKLSRLRLDADADLNRVRAVTSGAHSVVFGLVR